MISPQYFSLHLKCSYSVFASLYKLPKNLSAQRYQIRLCSFYNKMTKKERGKYKKTVKISFRLIFT